MIKIEISEDMKKMHRAYFMQRVLPNFKCDKYRNDDIFETNQNFFEWFIAYFRNNAEKVAIGNFDDLKEIHNEVDSRVSNIAPEERKKVKKYLIDKDIFGYEKFVNETIADKIIENAKFACSEKIYCEKVFAFIKKHYKELFSEDIFNDEYMKREELAEKILNVIFYNNVTLTNFENSILKRLDIWSPYIFVFMLNLRVCPYCNRQYITPLITKNGRMRGDLDHFLSKKSYPYFSMSLYNLIPCCKFCNSSLKKDKEFNFESLHPYVDDIDEYFRYKVSYITSEAINVSIPEGNYDSKVCSFFEMFKIKELAGYHDNIGKSFIQKRLCYPEEMLNDLLASRNNIYSNKRQLRAAVIGYVPEKTDINNEVLAKMKRDLAIQLEFVDEENNDETRNVLIEELRRLLFNSQDS